MSRKLIKKTVSIFLSATLMLGLCACKPTSQFVGGKLKVVCTVYPVYELTREIAGDKADVKLLVKPGLDPHGFELSTDDMLLIEDAELLIFNGANMEPWLPACLDVIENKSLTTLEAFEGTARLTIGDTVSEEFEEFEEELGISGGHDDDDDDHDDDDHEGHADHDGHDHSPESVDPHLWLSMDNSLVASRNICEKLSEMDRANSSYYEDNYNKFVSDIEDVKAEFADNLKGLEGKDIVVSHGAFGYMCDSLGLHQLPIEGITSDSEPDARTVSLIIDFIRAKNIKTVYYDSIINPSAAYVISEETGCEMIKLRSFGSITEEDYKNGLTYKDAMIENMNALLLGMQGN